MPLTKKLVFNLTFFLFVFSAIFSSVKAQDTLKNLPEFKLPLTDKKLVIAHCMTHILRYEGHPFEDGCNPEYYPVKGNFTSPIGGYTQVYPLAEEKLKHATLEQAVEFEMLAAKRMGIDGFQFYYVLGNKEDDNIIKTYFKVATQKNIDFKLTFCFSHPQIEGRDENMKLVEFASRVKGIMDEVGRDNPHWLRTPDGRLIVYMWYGEQLADVPPEESREGKSQYYFAARAYRKLANAVGDRFACLYSINEMASNSAIHKILDYFPAVWLWTDPYKTDGADTKVAAIAKKRNRTYPASVFNDFYTSKILKLNSETWEILWAPQAVAVGKAGGERKYLVTGLSETYRRLLDFAVKEKDNVSLINVITWNDYPEGHHLAPEINHNYGFAILLNYYKSLWKGEPSPYKDRDVAIAFFKKYKNGIKPDPYDFKAINLGSTTKFNFEDSIEVVTILPEAGQLVVNGETVNVPAGLTSTRFKYQVGAVSVAVMRNGVITKSFKTPEWITDKPERTDRITYSFDTEYDTFHKDLFGDQTPLYSTEYNLDINGAAKK